MNNSIVIKYPFLEKLKHFALFFLFSYPILPFFLVSVSVVFFLVVHILFYFIEKKDQLTIDFKVKLKNLLLFTGSYLILVVSLSYSADFKEGTDVLFKQIPLFLFPLVFILFPSKKITSVDLDKAFNYYVIICLILALFILGNFIYYFDVTEGFSAVFFRKRLKEIAILNLHPTYVSSFFSISIFYIIKKLSVKTNLFSIVALIIFLLTIILLTSRICLIALLIAVCVQLFLNFKNIKQVIITTIILTSISALIFNNKFIYERFTRVYSSGITMPDSKNLTSTNLRTGVFYCTYLIIKESPFLGLGVGDLQENLNNCYKEEFDTTLFQRRQFNTHNHHLFLLGSAGVFSLLSFLILQGWIISFLYRKKDYFLLSSFVFVFIVLLVESYLQRSYGISTYSILILILITRLIEHLTQSSKSE